MAEDMREADNKKKEAVTAKNDAETLSYQVEKQLSELKDKMSTADADELKKKLEEVRTTSAQEDADPEEIEAKTKELQDVSWRVTQQAYQSGSGDASAEAKDGENKEKEGEKKEKDTEK